MARYHWVGEVVDGVITRPVQSKRTATDKIDTVLTHKLWGSVAFVLLQRFLDRLGVKENFVVGQDEERTKLSGFVEGAGPLVVRPGKRVELFLAQFVQEALVVLLEVLAQKAAECFRLQGLDRVGIEAEQLVAIEAGIGLVLVCA